METSVRISATMALDALAESCMDVEKARHALRESIDQRDQLIRDAKTSGLPYRTLGRTTGLSLNRLQAIMAKSGDNE